MIIYLNPRSLLLWQAGVYIVRLCVFSWLNVIHTYTYRPTCGYVHLIKYYMCGKTAKMRVDYLVG